jgi:hypothetical protein
VWKAWEQAEAILGLLATFFIGFGMPLAVFGCLVTVSRWENGWLLGGLFIADMVILGGLAVWVARLASRAWYACYPEWRQFEQQQMAGSGPVLLSPFLPEEENEGPGEHLPLAVRMAVRLPRFPWLLRLPLGLWWLGHFSSGVFLALGAGLWFERAFPATAPQVRFLLAQGLGFAFVFAANLYLMLALGLFTRRPETLSQCWRWRLVIDAAVLLTAILLSLRE